MAGILAWPRNVAGFIGYHRHIIWALLMREISTRYGRDNIGYVWLIAEPMLFGTGVALLYSYIRSPFENGIPIVAFTLTGYMPMILFRQGVNYTMKSTAINNGLLYHRNITPLHLFISRFFTEFCGVSLAYMVEIFFANFLGLMPLPKDMLLLVAGWLLLTLQACGVAMIMNAMSEMFDVVERFIPLLTYLFIPISGFMYMIAVLPPRLQKKAIYIPFVHCFELMRSGYFGEFLTVVYNIPYALAWGVGFLLLGLLLQQFVRPRVEVL
jgi:capsular polysaccharide transport system permease protein